MRKISPENYIIKVLLHPHPLSLRTNNTLPSSVKNGVKPLLLNLMKTYSSVESLFPTNNHLSSITITTPNMTKFSDGIPCLPRNQFPLNQTIQSVRLCNFQSVMMGNWTSSIFQYGECRCWRPQQSHGGICLCLGWLGFRWKWS